MANRFDGADCFTPDELALRLWQLQDEVDTSDYTAGDALARTEVSDGVYEFDVQVDGTTVAVNGSNQLYAIGGDIIYARVNNAGGTAADTNLYDYDSGVSITGCVTASATGQFRNNNQVLADSQRVILVKRQDTGEYEPEQVGVDADSVAVADIIYARVNNFGGTAADTNLYNYDSGVSITGCATAASTGQFRNNNQVLGDTQRVILVKRSDTGEYEPEQVGGDAALGGGGGATGNVIYAQVNEGSGVTSANGTFAFDNAIAIVGTSPGTGTATNVHSQKYANNEWLLLYQRKSDNAWVTGRRPAAIFTGTAYASFAEGDANLQVENLTAIWGEAPTTTPLTVANTLKLTGATGDAVLVVENDDGNYLAVNNEHRITEWLKDQSGYNAANDQEFTHNAGTFTWVDRTSAITAVAILSTVAAATEDIATDADQCELSGVSVTCKALISTGTGKQAYHLTDSPSVTARSYYKTAITVTSGKWRLGYVVDGELIVADCAEFTIPPGA